MTHVVAVVVAAGRGRRFGADKIFHPLRGEPLVYWSLKTFHEVDEVLEVIPVVRDDSRERLLRLAEERDLWKIKRIVSGGQERKDSVFNALKSMGEVHALVLIHDGARPLVSAELIRRVIDASDEEVQGVIPVLPVRDTIKEVENGFVKRTIPRDSLVSVQTPQGFWTPFLYRAYRDHHSGNFTDDASVVERAGGRVKVIMGEESNIKITTREDILIAEALLERASSTA